MRARWILAGPFPSRWLRDSVTLRLTVRYMGDFAQDRVGVFRPDEPFGCLIVLIEVLANGAHERAEALEVAA